MENIRIVRVETADLKILVEIGRRTFFETYSNKNSESDMDIYVGHHFSLDKLSAETAVPDSHFFIAWDGSSPIGYMKLNCGRHKLICRKTALWKLNVFMC